METTIMGGVASSGLSDGLLAEARHRGICKFGLGALDVGCVRALSAFASKDVDGTISSETSIELKRPKPKNPHERNSTPSIRRALHSGP